MSADPIVLTRDQATELRRLLGGVMCWLTFGDRDAHRDLVVHLLADAQTNGGPFEHSAGPFSTVVDLVDRYALLLDRTDPNL